MAGATDINQSVSLYIVINASKDYLKDEYSKENKLQIEAFFDSVKNKENIASWLFYLISPTRLILPDFLPYNNTNLAFWQVVR
jgi:hypothetical protein